MTLSILLSLLGLVVLLLLSAFFSGSETALFSLGKLRLRRMKQVGNLKAEIVESMLVRPSRLLISILLGNTFVNILASSLATVLFISLMVRRGEIIAFVSKNFTLMPGDIILTGTPAGVGPLGHGDSVEVEIEHIGVLKNTVIDETA